MIGITLTVAVVVWMLGHILSHPPLVIVASAMVLVLTWATNSAGVCVVTLVVAGIVVAFVEARAGVGAPHPNSEIHRTIQAPTADGRAE
ncbi:MAG TPA: hypothetical protein VMB05_14530 [Solirubrobacteraceae bacterium]|nr:hypothetical protein [Solirubrobacteraceae bacterium]